MAGWILLHMTVLLHMTASFCCCCCCCCCSCLHCCCCCCSYDSDVAVASDHLLLLMEGNSKEVLGTTCILSLPETFIHPMQWSVVSSQSHYLNMGSWMLLMYVHMSLTEFCGQTRNFTRSLKELSNVATSASLLTQDRTNRLVWVRLISQNGLWSDISSQQS